MRTLRYLLEAAGLFVLYGFFAILPASTASAAGGWIGRTVGPRLAASRKARRNLETIFTDLTEKQKDIIITQMWDNLGRVFAEYPHLETIARERVTIVGGKTVKDVLKEGKGGIFIGGHLGNWEVNCAAMLLKFGQGPDLTYREPNNPFVAGLLRRARTLNGRLNAWPKARESGRKLVETLKNKGYLGILIDQKYNEGIAVPFLGRPAMTNPVAFQLAQKFGVPIIPVRCERVNGCHFILTAYPRLALNDASGSLLPPEQMAGNAHAVMESWIRENPGQWLWLHRRWDSKALKE